VNDTGVMQDMAADAGVLDAALDDDLAVPVDMALMEDMAPPPDMAFGPAPPVVQPPIDVTPESIQDGAIVDFVVIDPETLLVATPDGLWRFDGAVRSGLGDAPEALDAAVWFEGAAVLAADGAIWIVEDDGLARSPLADVVGVATDLAVLDDALWIASDTGLHRYADGMIQPILPEALPTEDARLTATNDALWIGTDQAIYAMDAEEAQPTGMVAADAAVVDADGVWAVGDRQLWWLDEDFFWWPVQLPLQPSAAAAHPAVPGVWLTDGAELWLLTDGNLIPYRGAPSGQLAADGGGAVLIATNEGLWRVTAERFIRVDPLPDRVTRTVMATIRPALPEQVETVTAEVDGMAVDVAGENPWTVELSPALGEGAHTLSVTVTWSDDAASDTAVDFIAHTVNWAEDIHPLSVDTCSQCHGAGATARPLHTAEQWRPIIDQIIDAVSTGRMPLAMESLTPDQITLITDWLDAGLPEDRP
jgi:mono/diheme cytochrome c family protein